MARDQFLPPLGPNDLKGEPFRLNELLSFLAEQISKTQGYQGAFVFGTGHLSFPGLMTFRTTVTAEGAVTLEGTVAMTDLPTYADNATALAAGLLPDRLYRTATGQLMVVYQT